MFDADYKPTQERFAKKHKGSIIIAGGAPSFATHDLAQLHSIPVIGCNCILQHVWFKPDYLMFSDRRPYVGELPRLARYHGNVLLSTTLFDPRIRCGGVPVQEVPKGEWWPWRVGTCRTPFNWTTFEKPLCSFATAAGQLLQAAVIMGARRVGTIGIDMQKPRKGKLHWHEQTVDLEHLVVQADGTLGPKQSMELFAKARDELKGMGIKVCNLSPVKDSAFARVFGNYDYDRFIKEAADL